MRLSSYLTLPSLPTTGVGSISKPDYVKASRGKLDRDSRQATLDFIRRQERMGFDILVDGELYRGDMATDYARALGLPIAGWTRTYGNRFWHKGIVDRDLQRGEPIQVEQFVYAQGLTSKPVKGMLTGPTTLANWNFDDHYKDREALVRAWGKVIRQEAFDLKKAGAKFIQIDEPAVGERPWETELFREGLRMVTDGLGVYTITHVCYGDFPLVYPYMKYLPVDQVDIELASELDLGLRGSDLLKMMKEDPLTRHKDVAVGVIDVRPDVGVESVDTVERRIRTALDVFGPDILIKADCGYRTTKNPPVEYAKMENMMQAVKQVRESLSR